jgi:hypothetical protein
VSHVDFIQFGEFLVLKSQNRPLQDLLEIDWKERNKDRTLRPSRHTTVLECFQKRK